ncbi:MULTISPECIES: hypothetical protein [Catenuloplanes]|uniref:Uncharacterized protein n=1 Tax=Catenuloplanes niger TaxID=587534 RepID=A0AAE4CX93_9ACTN|nr:hypothetical protein [Catenuloplanes niger]MDR7328000.1 hypothetical protein [Catenuloplanes niger]
MADAYLSNDENTGSPYAGGVIDTGWDSVVPLGGAAKSLMDGFSHDGEVADIAAGITDLGFNALSFGMDPLNWLISAGLTFVIDFFQPLEDALSLVTGNAERMEPHAKQWAAIGAALAPLSAAIRQAVDDDLIEWKGQDADAARALLREFAYAVEATGAEAGTVGDLLMLFSKLMGVAQSLIISIIASVVEWALIEWALALGLAVPSAGASVAAAATATTVQIATGTTRAIRIINKVVQIIWKIGAVLQKIMPASLVGKVGASVVDTAGSGFAMSAILKIAGGVAADGLTYSPAMWGMVWQGAKNSDQPSMSDERIDTVLDRSA